MKLYPSLIIAGTVNVLSVAHAKGGSFFDNSIEEYLADHCGIDICNVHFEEEGSTVTLTKDYECASGSGPTMYAGSTLDCQGHTIACTSEDGGCSSGIAAGIAIVGDGVTIKNCIVEGPFKAGVGSWDGYGEATIHNVKVSNAADYGILIGGDSTLKNVIAVDNGKVGVFIDGETANKFENVFACNNDEQDIESTFGTLSIDEFKGEIICGEGDLCNLPVEEISAYCAELCA